MAERKENKAGDGVLAWLMKISTVGGGVIWTYRAISLIISGQSAERNGRWTDAREEKRAPERRRRGRVGLGSSSAEEKLMKGNDLYHVKLCNVAATMVACLCVSRLPVSSRAAGEASCTSIVAA